MNEERFTSFIEDDGYWIRDESDFKIIATGLKLGVALNLRAYLNELNDENKELKKENEELRQFINKGRRLSVKELMANTNENELLKKKIKELEKENKELQKYKNKNEVIDNE